MEINYISVSGFWLLVFFNAVKTHKKSGAKKKKNYVEIWVASKLLFQKRLDSDRTLALRAPVHPGAGAKGLIPFPEIYDDK